MTATRHAPEGPLLSVVVPMKDEEDNAASLVQEITAALAGEPHEILIVDDGSVDATLPRLKELMRDHPGLRVLRHQRNCGQSAGIRTGVLAARGDLIATLDGDRQNDPADIPAMLQMWRAASEGSKPPLGLIAGHRVNRRDDWVKRLTSRVGNGVRAWALGDRTPDTGCGLKLFRRDVFLRLPYFDHMHRFLPALVLREGFAVTHHPVNHRPREAGRTKYGVLNRLFVSMHDLLGVMWLKGRMRRPHVEEVAAEASANPGTEPQ